MGLALQECSLARPYFAVERASSQDRAQMIQAWTVHLSTIPQLTSSTAVCFYVKMFRPFRAGLYFEIYPGRCPGLWLWPPLWGGRNVYRVIRAASLFM